MVEVAPDLLEISVEGGDRSCNARRDKISTKVQYLENVKMAP